MNTPQRTTMKRSFLRSFSAVAVLSLAVSALAQDKGVAVNNDGRAPNPHAILDVSSNYLPLGTAIQKGMLIPRLTLAQRNALGAVAGLPQGLTIYQLDNTPGFYVVEYGQWFKIDGGSDSWNITGNNTGTPVNDFFGTRDDQDLVFKTNNTQVMRMEGTPATRYVHIGTATTTPNERLDVTNAIRIFNPSPGSWAATNPATRFAAGNDQGTILFRPSGTGTPGDSLQATFNPGGNQNRNILMWNGHWGNIDGTAPANLAAADANAGGWNRLENEYEERFTKAYTQQGTPACVTTNATVRVLIPQVDSTVAANFTSSLASPVREFVSVYPHNTSARIRHQHMYLKDELNVEINQLSPTGNPLATGGLCAGQPITAIGFRIGAGGATKAVPLNGMSITIKHAPLGVNNLSAGFDLTTDPAQSCYVQLANTFRPTVANNWENFTPLSQPFVWDGARNIIVEISYATTASAAAQPPVLFGPSPGAALLTASWNSTSLLAPCANTAPAGFCPAANAPGGMPWANAACGVLNTNGGTTQFRPVVRFYGTVATAPAATSGNNSFIWYNGGLIVESTTSPNPWGRQETPYWAFRGPGTISAEKGVYDGSTKLNDHVFDRAFDGAVNPADAETFGSVRNLDIDEMSDVTRVDRHLPTMKGRDSWRAERGFSLGDLTNQLWTTAETQALYVSDLHDRLNVLELLSTDRPVGAEESAVAKNSIRTIKGYTDAEKAALMNSIDRRTVTTNQR